MVARQIALIQKGALMRYGLATLGIAMVLAALPSPLHLI
jgi:hypothetical protein